MAEWNVNEYAATFRRDGYAVVDDVIPGDMVTHLREAVASIPQGEEVRRKRSVYGVRNLLEVCPAVQRLAADPRVRQFVTPVLGAAAFAVRAIFFDKVADANWSLGWHQDSVISTKRRLDIPGFVGWSQKVGVWQVQPPPEVLARMVAVRVHLDDCGPDNGPLRVIPATHGLGWLDDEIEQWKQRGPQVTCCVKIGGVVSMCPLVLHASAASESVDHRRVIHIEYACDELPGALDWNTRIGGCL